MHDPRQPTRPPEPPEPPAAQQPPAPSASSAAAVPASSPCPPLSFSAAAAGQRTVVLEHRLPDGSSHFDWLLESTITRDDDRTLAAFRLSQRPDDPALLARTFEARAITPHRLMYLTYEGPIAGDRGSVRRVREGVITLVDSAMQNGNRDTPDGVRIVIEWLAAAAQKATTMAYHAHQASQTGEIWRISCIAATSSAE